MTPASLPLNDEHEALLEFLYLCPVGLIRTDLSGTIEMLNPKAAQFLLPVARDPGTLVNLFDALQNEAPELRNLVSAHKSDRGVVCENHLVEIRSGAAGIVSILALTVIGLAFGRIMTVLQDVTKLVEVERALRSREQRLEAIFNGVRDYAIYSLDAAGHIDTWNKSAERVEGYIAEEAIGREYGLDYPPEQQAPAQIAALLKSAERQGWLEDEGWRIRRDGERFWGNTMVSVLRESDESDARAQGFSVITRDITDRKRSEDELRRLASTDYLTGVYNRRYFFAHAPANVARCFDKGEPASVIMSDLDHFKVLNDTQGHQMGDRALKLFADICTQAVDGSGMVARFGGEEFVILLENRNRDAAVAVAEDIRTKIRQARTGFTVSLGVASIGIGLETALRAADRALYRAKELGRNRVVAADI